MDGSTSETKRGIFRAMHAVMSEVGVIGKDRTNPQQGYKFRGIDDVLAVIQPIFIKHGIFVVPKVLKAEREVLPTKSGGSMASVRLLVEHTFFAADGSRVYATTFGEAMDSGDKASNKAMSAALKYALIESFSIPTYESDRDTEEQSPEMAPRTQSGKPPSTAAATRPAPKPVAKPTQSASGAVFPNYGRAKGAPVAGASKGDLEFYRNGCLRSLADPAKSNFHAKENALLAAIDDELSRHMGAHAGGRAPDDDRNFDSSEPPPPGDDDAPF